MMAAETDENKPQVEVEKEKSTEEEKEKSTEGEEEIAALNVNNELSIKHPLQNTWTWWFFKTKEGRSWEDNQMKVASFCTVEDFWALYNHVELASKIKVGCDYSLFKEGIKPMWEDKINCDGGRWLINLNKQNRAAELDVFWMEMLLLMIGESFEDHSDDVCGAVVNVRGKGDKIGVWTKDARNGTGIMRIGHVLKGRLQIPPHMNIGYQAHKDSMAKSGSTAKNRYTV